MKQQVTFEIDTELMSKVKLLAQSRGVSLSSMFEDALRMVLLNAEVSFTTKWKGAFRPTMLESDPRYNALAKKYL